MKTVILPPDAPTLMWATRSIGYTTPAAVADLIDNSISAGASKIKIEFLSGETPYFSILDNGEGMSSSELRQAMKYGSSNPFQSRQIDDLGRFGLGLKTASLSQCKKLTVVSKKNEELSSYCWDLDHVFDSGQWELIELTKEEICELPQISTLLNCSNGTIVIWNKLDKIFAGDNNTEASLLLHIREVEDHLALTFHRFLQGEPGIKKIEIQINEIPIKPINPFFKSDEMPPENIPVDYTDSHGRPQITTVCVTPFILPFSDSLTQEELDYLGGKDGLIKSQGFYIYRNKRLIVAADWFRLTRKTDLTKLCRVRVDIPSCLDEIWTIDVKKSMAIPPAVVLTNLRRIISPIIKAGKRKYKFRAIKETDNTNTKVWLTNETRNGIIYSINPDYPIYKHLLAQTPDKKTLQIFIKLIEQTIPVNAIHSDFYDDKKYAFEDVDVSLQNAIFNLKSLLKDVKPEDRKAVFEELMGIMPFSEFDLKFDDLGDIENG